RCPYPERGSNADSRALDPGRLRSNRSRNHSSLGSSSSSAIPVIRKQIEQGAAWEDRIASAVYLPRAVRNQVAHSIDDSMVLYKDPPAATFTVDVLSLYRVEGRIGIQP